MKMCVSPLAAIMAAGFLQAQPAGKLQPDPAANPPTVIDGKVADVPVPDRLFSPKVAFAGHYAVVGGRTGNTSTFAVTDLTTGKAAGSVQTNALDSPLALSPDGKLLAGAPGFAKQDSIAVYGTADGKLLRTIAAEKRVDHLRFIDSERVLAVSSWEHFATVFNAKTGDKIKRVEFGSRSQVNQFPIGASPGGNLIAYVKDGTLEVADLRNDAETALGTIPKQGAFDLNVQGIAFSVDGKEIAVVGESFGKNYGQIWNLEDGKAGPAVELPKAKQVFYKGAKVEATPDGAGWLYSGEQVLERKSLLPLWKAPEAGNASPDYAATALAGNQFMRLEVNGLKKKIAAVGVPKEQIAEAAKIARAGGDARDAGLPKMTVADLDAAKKVEVPLGGVKWAYTAPRAEDAGRLAARPFPVDIKGNEAGDMHFSSAAAGVAALEIHATNQPFNKTPSKGVDAYNLATGRKVGHLDFPQPSQVLGLSPDGKKLLILDDEKRERIDLYGFDGKAVAAWRPYEKLAAEAERKVAFGAILDESRILTANAKGILAIWSIPDCKALAVAEVANLSQCRLSADRKFVVGLDSDLPRAFDCATLQPAGDGEASGAAAPGKKEPRGLAFRADGGEIAALMQVGPIGIAPRWFAARWDAKTGKLLGEFEFFASGIFLPGREVAFNYAGKYLLFDNRLLLDPETGAPVWNYALNAIEGKAALRPVDDRLWYIAGPFTQAANLVAVRVPEPAAVKFIERVDKGNAIFASGSKIKIRESLAGEGKALVEKFGDNLLKSGGEAIRRSGNTEDAGAEAELTLDLGERDIGRTVSYRMFGLGRANIDVKLYEITAQADLRQGGTVLWKSAPEKLGMEQHFVHMPAGEKDVGQFLRKSMWNAGIAWAARLTLPRRIVRTEEGLLALPGNTLLRPEGAQMQPPMSANN